MPYHICMQSKIQLHLSLSWDQTSWQGLIERLPYSSDSPAHSSTFTRSHWLSYALIWSRAFSSPLTRSHHLLYTLLTSHALASPLVHSPHLASSINRTQNRSLKWRTAKKSPSIVTTYYSSFFCQLWVPPTTWWYYRFGRNVQIRRNLKRTKSARHCFPKWIMLNFLRHFTLYFRV